MIRLVIKVVFGIPVLIAGAILMSVGAETGGWILGWPIIGIALLVMLLGAGVMWKAWKMFRGS